jgi:hypothetical protein
MSSSQAPKGNSNIETASVIYVTSINKKNVSFKYLFENILGKNGTR